MCTDNFNFFLLSQTLLKSWEERNGKKLNGWKNNVILISSYRKVDMSHEFVSLKQSDCQMSNMD